MPGRSLPPARSGGRQPGAGRAEFAAAHVRREDRDYEDRDREDRDREDRDRQDGDRGEPDGGSADEQLASSDVRARMGDQRRSLRLRQPVEVLLPIGRARGEDQRDGLCQYPAGDERERNCLGTFE